jgi:hypothetical protein
MHKRRVGGREGGGRGSGSCAGMHYRCEEQQLEGTRGGRKGLTGRAAGGDLYGMCDPLAPAGAVYQSGNHSADGEARTRQTLRTMCSDGQEGAV